jgi:hypothetical protein
MMRVGATGGRPHGFKSLSPPITPSLSPGGRGEGEGEIPPFIMGGGEISSYNV